MAGEAAVLAVFVEGVVDLDWRGEMSASCGGGEGMEGETKWVATYGPWVSLGAPALRSPRNSLRLIERPLKFHAGEEEVGEKYARRVSIFGGNADVAVVERSWRERKSRNWGVKETIR